MYHFTMTGPYAGQPFCGCNKEEEIKKGNKFCHVPYSDLGKFFAEQAICPDCLAVWNQSD